MRSLPAFAATLVLLAAALLPPHAGAMNKAELIDAIASESGLSKADAKRALDGFIAATTKALKKGDRIALVGFGSFTVTNRTNRANACGSAPDVDFHPAAAFNARKEEGGRHTPFQNRISAVLPQADGTVIVLGRNNGALVESGNDCIVRKRPGRAAQPDLQATIVSVLVTNRGGGAPGRWVEFVASASGDGILGVVLSGVGARDLGAGDVLETLPPPVTDDPIGPCPDGDYQGSIVSDGEIFKEMIAETRIPEERLAAAYNALLDTIIDVVNARDLVDLGPEFGAFVEETFITASVADDPCAGIPENCPPTGVPADTAYPYIAFDVSAQTGAFTAEQIAGLKDTIEGIANAAARTGRNPQTGKEIKISAKNVVRFKAGADLASKVN